MSIINPVDSPEQAARQALIASNAVRRCRLHAHIIIRVWDRSAENRALELAREMQRSDGSTWPEPEVSAAISDLLDHAADGACPECASL